MSQHDVKNRLEQFQKDLKAIDIRDDETPEEIQQMLTHVSKTLDHLEAREHREALLRHMQESITLFEARHPEFTLQINSLIQTLSNAGL